MIEVPKATELNPHKNRWNLMCFRKSIQFGFIYFIDATNLAYNTYSGFACLWKGGIRFDLIGFNVINAGCYGDNGMCGKREMLR